MERRKSFYFMFVSLLVMLALLVGLGVTAADARRNRLACWLTLHHNNDGESDLLPTPIFDDEEKQIGAEGGAAYFKSVLDRARMNCLKKLRRHRARSAFILVSSGDNFLAGPAFTASLEDGVFYDAMALDMLKYNAISFGNHDFDFGPDLLGDFISEGYRKPGRPPYVCANIDVSKEPSLQVLYDSGVITESTVVKVRGQKFGIIGAITPVLATISSPRDVIVLSNVAELVQKQVDKLEAMGINKIIFISHLQDVDADAAVIGQLRGVDIAVAGGGDELLANCSTVENCEDILLPSDLLDEDEDEIPDALAGPYPIIASSADGKEVPVVTTAGQYGYLGQLVVGFDKFGNVIAIDGDRSGPIRVVSGEFTDAVKPNEKMQRRVVEPVEQFVAELDANVIAQSEVDLDGRRSPGVRTMETNEGNLIADALRWQAVQLAADFDVPAAQVALQNGGGIRNDSIIPAGDITELDTFDMVPFPNFVAVFPEITHNQFKKVLENAVSRIDPPAAEGGTGRFAQISGFSFTYDPGETPMLIDLDGTVLQEGSRVREATLDDGRIIVSEGTVQNPDNTITVATIDFLAREGDQYPFGDTPFTVLGASYQQALSNYIQTPTADGGLGGVITAEDYPEGGEERITELP